MPNFDNKFSIKPSDIYGLTEIKIPEDWEVIDFRVPVPKDWYLENGDCEIWEWTRTYQPVSPRLIVKQKEKAKTLPEEALCITAMSEVYDYENRGALVIPSNYLYDGFRPPKRNEYFLDPATCKPYFAICDNDPYPKAILKHK